MALLMHTMQDGELIDYYHTYCELTIWFRKMVLRSDKKALISAKDIAGEFIAERNRMLAHVPPERRMKLRRKLNRVATSFYDKIANWTRTQKNTIDMV